MALASGCVAKQSDSRPELVIEIFWEDGSDGTRDDGETCVTAGVAFATWQLILVDDGFDEVVAESEPDEACLNTLAFADIPPGEYRLQIRGDDEEADTQWRGDCRSLFVDRFNELYGCRAFLVDQVDATDGSEPSERDGGSEPSGPDAGSQPSEPDAGFGPAEPDGGSEAPHDAGMSDADAGIPETME